jgi:toxin ParE1/3/4
MTVSIHPEAERDLADRLDYYERQNPGLGYEFVREVRNSIEFLQIHPEMGQRIDAQLRRILLRRFPYSIIYARDNETIRVLSVAHHHRRPGYWRDRMERN